MILFLLTSVVGLAVFCGVQYVRVKQLEDVVYEHDEALDELWCDVQEIDQYLSAPDVPPHSAETAH